jgi:outer membrane protein TolC
MLLLAFLLVAAQDTTRLTAAAALDRALDPAAGRLAVAEARRAAARGAGRELAAPANPSLQAMVENLGAQRQVTGRDGLAGTEGQLVLSQPLTLGGDVAARRRLGGTGIDVADAQAAIAVADIAVEVLEAIAGWERDRAILAASGAERDALARVATAMTARAAEGRDATASAALARIEAAAAASRHARHLGDAARSNAALAALVHLEGGTPVAIGPARCAGTPLPVGQDVPPPEHMLQDARLASSAAGTDLVRALRIPDLLPQVGFRRSAGFSGLLLGISFDLPIRNRHGGALEAARAEQELARGQALAERETMAGAAVGHRRALAALTDGTLRYDAAWQADLEAIVAAEEARLAVGEGSLYRLFEARRLRLAAVIEAEDWRLEVRRQRIRLARTTGTPLVATLLCLPEDPE